MDDIIQNIIRLQDNIPVQLNEFIHMYTPLPCTLSIRDPHTRTVWRRVLSRILESSKYPEQMHVVLAHLKRQMWTEEHAVVDDDCVVPICDPIRLKQMYEMDNETYGNRLHYLKLMSKLVKHDEYIQATMMMEGILDVFPTGGRNTETMADLIQLATASMV